VPSLATPHPDNNDHPLSESPDRQNALLTVVKPLILNIEREIVEDFGCVVEIQAALAKRCLALVRIVSDRHLM
jgi:hypothetical protein